MKQMLVNVALTTALVSTIGCGMNDSPSANDGSSSSLRLTTVRIHINGFKKSKSGAT